MVQYLPLNVINAANFQNIESAFKHLSNNSIIILPKETYSINESINLDNLDHIKIIGYGAIINCNITKDSIKEGTEYITAFNINNCSDISIQGITLDGGFKDTSNNYIYSNESNSKLINAKRCNGLYFYELSFTGHSTNRLNSDTIGRYDSGVLIIDSNNIILKNCIYNYNHMEGIWIENSNNITINGLDLTCGPHIWSALNIFICNNVNILNSNIIVRYGSLDDIGTINIYSSNVNITNCHFKGGSGIDLSDESNIFNTDEKNFTMTNCILECKYGFHQSGDKFIDNVNITNCKINSYYGLYLYHTSHRKVKNIFFKNNTFNVISVLRYRALGNIQASYDSNNCPCTNSLSNISFTGNNIYCESINESLKFNPILGSEKGGSVAFVFFDESSNTNGNELIENIQITSNKVYCDGGLILIPSSSKFKVRNISIKNNTILPLSSTLQVKNPIHVSNSNYITIDGNILIDCKCINLIYCSNIYITNNIKILCNTIQDDNGYYIYKSSDFLIIKNNILNSYNLTHIKGYENNFTTSIIQDNTPNTFSNI